MGADVGLHPPGHRVDADHRLPTELDTVLRNVAVGQQTSPADWRPSITSSFEKPKKNESLRSSNVTSTASDAVSDKRVASSSPPKPAPRISTCRFIARSYLALHGPTALPPAISAVVVTVGLSMRTIPFLFRRVAIRRLLR